MRRPLIFAGVLLLTVCVILVAADRCWLNLYLDHEIRPLDVATLAVNLFIAYFLQYYLGSKAGDDRAEKDLLIESMKDVLSTMKECRDNVRACYDAGKISKAQAKLIVLLHRRIANSLNDVETQVRLSRCSKLSGECRNIKHALFRYKTATTGASFPTKPYDIQTLTYQEQTYNTLHSLLQALLFKVNSYR